MDNWARFRHFHLGVYSVVASGLDINSCVLSYFEGTANLHCYTSCTLTTLHCNKVSFQIKSNTFYCQITCALVSEILESVLQTVQKQFTYRQYILTDLYKRQCVKYTQCTIRHTYSYQYTLYTLCTHSTLCTHLYTR